MSRLPVCAFLALTLVACDKKGDEAASAAPSVSPSVSMDDDQIPVPSDFADEAESIGNDDYKAKLDDLQAEIDKEDK